MPTEDELKTQLKRLRYWSKDVPYVPPKRILKDPNDTNVDNIKTVFGELKTIKIETHD